MKSQSGMRQFRRTLRYLAALATLSLLTATTACGGESKSSSNITPSPSSAPPSSTKLSLTDLIARARPSVAEITGMMFDEWQSGSGFVIDANKGLVLTNDHVVSGVSSIEVSLNERKISAAVVAEAPCDDLAVIQLNLKPSDLTELRLGNSKELRPGDEVVALGYPGSAQNPSMPPQSLSATQGAVSTNDVPAEPGPASPSFSSVIMHQASLSPGNSGGPLLNDRGEVVGVNTFGNRQGQNYSISSNAVKDLLPSLEAGKYTNYVGWTLQPMTPEWAARLTHLRNPFPAPPVSSQGLLVLNVDTGSAAEAAKFRPGDIIVALDNTPVNNLSLTCKIVASHRSGMKIGVQGYESVNRGSWQGYRTSVTMR